MVNRYIIQLKQFEESIKDLFLGKKIRFPCHLSGGNEDALVGIFKKVKKGDWVFSTHRNHYHALLSGAFSPEELKEWILGKGSMHVYNQRFFTSGIVGGVLPIAVGVAMGVKNDGGDEHVWCFVGDMAAQTGVFNECTKYASGHELPITFIVEDNGYSVDTPTLEVWGENGVENVIRYKYERVYPHQGSGDFVIF